MPDLAHRRSGRAHVLAVATGASLVVAGCGTAHTKAGLTKAQFAAQADAICRAEQAKLVYLRHKAGPLQHVRIARSLIRKEVATDRAATAKLESLAQPPGDAARIGKWITARTVAATVAIDVAEAPARENQTAVNDVLDELKRATALSQRLAGEYGLEVCRATE